MKVHITVTLLLLAGNAQAYSGCDGLVTKNIRATANVDKGATLHDLHLDSVNDDGSPATYAEAGGDIYPADSIRLLNCHIVKRRLQIGVGFEYETVLDDTPANASAILTDSVEGRLAETGLDNADAANAAQAYVDNPSSACGKAAKMLLDGQSEMTGVIESSHVCQPDSQ